MHLAEERQHMMLAQGVEINILDHHHLAIVLFKKGGAQNGLRVLFIALAEELHRFTYTVRRFQQSFPLRILTDLRQHRLHRFGNGSSGLRIGMKILQVHSCFTKILSRTI